MFSPNPTEIAEAVKEAKEIVDIYGSGHGQVFFCTNDQKKHDIGQIVKTILAALEAIEKERDDGEKMSQALKQVVFDLTDRVIHAEAEAGEYKRLAQSLGWDEEKKE